MNCKQALKKYELNNGSIPLLDGLKIFFDKKHHSSGYNFIVIVGYNYEAKYEKIIARYSDVINLRFDGLYGNGHTKYSDINIDFCDGCLHMWTDQQYLIKCDLPLLSSARFDLIPREKESDKTCQK